MSPAMVAAALLLALSAPGGGGDAIKAFNDYNIRYFIILKCHAMQDEEDRAYLAREPEVTRAALEEIREHLDAAIPGESEESVTLAREILDIMRAVRDSEIQSQADEYGCAWLDGRL